MKKATLLALIGFTIFITLCILGIWDSIDTINTMQEMPEYIKENSEATINNFKRSIASNVVYLFAYICIWYFFFTLYRKQK